MVFDFTFWIATLTLSLVMAIACSYLGWERKYANRISIAVMFFILSIVLISGSYFINSGNFAFANNKFLLASIGESKVSNSDKNQELKKTDFDELVYSISFGSSSNDYGKSIILDKDGNAYTTGSFHGTISLDAKGKGEKTSLGGIGDDTDIYLAKYDKYGEYIWGFSLGSIGYDAPTSVKLNGGYVYLSGYFGGRADFDPSEKEFILDAGIGRDGFVAKYDSDGRFLWAQKIGNLESIPFEDNDIRFEQVSALGFDESENVYATGYFDDELIFTDSDGKESSLMASKYSKNVFLAKYDKDGKLMKIISLAGGVKNEPRGIVVGVDGIYLAGVFNSKIALDSVNSKKFIYTNGAQDIFLAKYDMDFNYLWGKKWGGISDDNVNSFVLSKSGTMLASGSFGGSINFSGIKVKSSGDSDAFVIRVDNDGEVVFAKAFGGEGKDGGLFAETDSVDNIYLVGYFSDNVNFDPNKMREDAELQSYSSGEATDAFIAKYNNTGGFVWVRSLGGDVSLSDEFQNYSGVAVDTLDYPVVIGSFAGEYGSDDIKVSSRGGMDSIIIKYSPEGYKKR